jgi:hypothetical protein
MLVKLSRQRGPQIGGIDESELSFREADLCTTIAYISFDKVR